VLESDEATLALVRGLYDTLLHRPPDDFGLAAFAGALRAGASEEAVVFALASSEEYYRRRS
jgi:hypothetical protein